MQQLPAHRRSALLGGQGRAQDVFKAQTQISVMETRIARLEQEIPSREAEINSLLSARLIRRSRGRRISHPRRSA